jgi:hypothetical protein
MWRQHVKNSLCSLNPITGAAALKGSLQRQLFEIKRKKQKQDAQDAEAARLLSE